MSISLTCGLSGTVVTGETEEELVANVQAHARAHQNTEVPASRSWPRSALGTASGPSTRGPVTL
jgi:hypothetical protein